MLLPRCLKCCQCKDECLSPDKSPSGSALDEPRVISLTSDVMEAQLVQPVHLLTRPDALDLTAALASDSQPASTSPITRQQQYFKEQLRLPHMRRYPLPPHCSADDPEERKHGELLQMYQEFVLDLHKGLHMTQLTANQDYSRIHCQILSDLQTLKVDQGSGCIIEFPLCAVSKVYRIMKHEDKWYSAGALAGTAGNPAEHIVVVEFVRRKLAFVFTEIVSAQCFLLCMELLIRRAREIRAEEEHSLGLARAKAPPPGRGPPVFVRGERLKAQQDQAAPPQARPYLLFETPVCPSCKAEACQIEGVSHGAMTRG